MGVRSGLTGWVSPLVRNGASANVSKSRGRNGGISQDPPENPPYYFYFVLLINMTVVTYDREGCSEVAGPPALVAFLEVM